MSEKINNLVAGSCAGMIEAIITWPTENIKTQMQFFNQKLSFQQTAKNIYNSGGFQSFYRGISPVLFFNIPKVASRFYSYEYMSKHLENQNKNVRTIFSGLFAGFVESTLITVPSETIKTKMIKNDKLTVFDILKTKGLYQGYVPTLTRQSLNQASRFYFYQNYKEYIEKKERFTSFHSFVGGVGAGCFSVLISTPADVVKTQMQEGEKHKIKFLIDNIWRENGIKGFWRGSLARLLRVAPGQGVMFLTYDYVNKILNKI